MNIIRAILHHLAETPDRYVGQTQLADHFDTTEDVIEEALDTFPGRSCVFRRYDHETGACYMITSSSLHQISPPVASAPQADATQPEQA